MTTHKLTYYTGNYDTFCKTVKEKEVVQQKKYEKEQDDIKHLIAFISSCGLVKSRALGLPGYRFLPFLCVAQLESLAFALPCFTATTALASAISH